MAKIAVRCGDDAHVRLLLHGRSDRREASLLEDTQQLGLHVERRLANLVEEQRSSLRCAEETLAVGYRARERAAPMAEERALEQLRREPGTIDGDEPACGAPRRERMNRARDDLLARSGLPEHEDGRIRRRDERDHLAHAIDRRADADEALAFLRHADDTAEAGDLLPQPVALDGVPKLLEQIVMMKRLRDEAESALLHGLDREIDRAVCSQDDRRERLPTALRRRRGPRIRPRFRVADPGAPHRRALARCGRALRSTSCSTDT